jgi:hypothetical protein
VVAAMVTVEQVTKRRRLREREAQNPA